MKNLKGMLDEVGRMIRHLAATPDTYRAPPEKFNRHEYAYWTFENQASLTLRETEAEQYFKCLRGMRQLLSPRGEWSDEALASRLRSLVFWALRTAREAPADFPAQLEGSLKRFGDELSAAAVAWESIFPIVGLYRECIPYTLGVVTFESGQTLPDELMGSSPGPEASAMPSYAHSAIKKELTTAFAQEIIARAQCSAVDEEGARALNLATVLRTLDVVNFFGDIYRPGAYRAHAMIASEVPHGQLSSVTRKPGEVFQGGGSSERTGRIDDVWLPPLESEDAQAFGLTAAHELLAMREKSQVATRILTALQWAGRAAIERRSEQAFLAYAISLEALLLGVEKDGDITFRLKVRAAHLAARPDIASRRAYADELATLYDVRSRIVHQGRTAVSSSEVEHIREFAKGCIIAALNHPGLLALVSSKDLERWFDERVYSG
jgi:hypothetical protein